MWRAQDEPINTAHVASEIYYVCRVLALSFFLLGLVRAGDTYRQLQFFRDAPDGQFTTINPFWLAFNGITAVLFFVVGTYLWLESKGPKVKRDNTKTAGLEAVLRERANGDGL